jgi:hypothetical protein
MFSHHFRIEFHRFEGSLRGPLKPPARPESGHWNRLPWARGMPRHDAKRRLRREGGRRRWEEEAQAQAQQLLDACRHVDSGVPARQRAERAQCTARRTGDKQLSGRRCAAGGLAGGMLLVKRQCRGKACMSTCMQDWPHVTQRRQATSAVVGRQLQRCREGDE